MNLKRLKVLKEHNNSNQKYRRLIVRWRMKDFKAERDSNNSKIDGRVRKYLMKMRLIEESRN